MVLVQPVLDDVTLRRRQPLLELLRLHLVGERWQVDALEAEARLTERREHADLRPRVVPAAERAAHVAGADADREEHGLVARLGEAEALFHEARERLEAVARVEQRKRRLQRGRVCALLEDRRALAVVLADHDDGAADDAGGGDVRERVGGDVGADHRLPRDGAARRVVDRRAQERRRGGLAPRLFEVDPEGLEQRLVRVGQDVDQVRDGRARVTAHVAHTRLEQGLGDREDALAAQDLPRAVGARMFEHAVATLRADSARVLRIASDPYAEGFYLRMGARRVGEWPSTPSGRTLPLLVWEVRPARGRRM